MDVQAQITPNGELTERAPVPAKADGSQVFDLGNSGGANIATDKDSMIAEAFNSLRKRGTRST